jgi:hypothetical protein
MKKIVVSICILIVLSLSVLPVSANGKYWMTDMYIFRVYEDRKEICTPLPPMMDSLCFPVADNVRVIIPEIPGPESLYELTPPFCARLTFEGYAVTQIFVYRYWCDQ